MASLAFSPVNILKDPPQIATEGFSMVLRPEGFLDRHTKSLENSKQAKFCWHKSKMAVSLLLIIICLCF